MKKNSGDRRLGLNGTQKETEILGSSITLSMEEGKDSNLKGYKIQKDNGWRMTLV